MSKIQFKRATSNNLPPVEDGSIVVTIDDKQLYVDKGSDRLQLTIGTDVLQVNEDNSIHVVQKLSTPELKVGENIKDVEKSVFTVATRSSAEDTKDNSFVVYEDGHATVLTMGTTDDSVATKSYVDTKTVIPRISAVNAPLLDKIKEKGTGLYRIYCNVSEDAPTGGQYWGIASIPSKDATTGYLHGTIILTNALNRSYISYISTNPSAEYPTRTSWKPIDSATGETSIDDGEI